MLLQDLVDTIERLKARLETHNAELRANEIRTRMALIDPVLAVLGWDPADPSLVMPEYVLESSKERADYALIRPDGKIAAILEAKKLGESLETHRMQMLNYANADGVDYAGITDGNFWQLYSVFERGPLADRLILNISLSNDPVYEIALHMLVLWRLNLKSGNIISAKKPALTGESWKSETVSKPDTVLQRTNPPPRVPLGWFPMDQVTPVSKQNAPKAMSLPDGSEIEIKYWGDILTQTATWLSSNGYLSRHNLPIKSSDRRYIASSEPVHPNGNRFAGTFKVPNAQVFVEKNVSATRAIEYAKRLLDHCNQGAVQLRLKIG